MYAYSKNLTPDLISPQEENETKSPRFPRIDCESKGIKKILISISINIALWCLAIYLAFLISKYLPVSL